MRPLNAEAPRSQRASRRRRTPAAGGSLRIAALAVSEAMAGTSRTALVIVDHGSRSDASNASLDDVVREVEQLAGDRYLVVLAAHMELASPSIGDAFGRAVAAGAAAIVVALYFLGPGRHSETDVPRLVREAASRHPGVDVSITSCLGPDRTLAALVVARADAAATPAKS